MKRIVLIFILIGSSAFASDQTAVLYGVRIDISTDEMQEALAFCAASNHWIAESMTEGFIRSSIASDALRYAGLVRDKFKIEKQLATVIDWNEKKTYTKEEIYTWAMNCNRFEAQ